MSPIAAMVAQLLARMSGIQNDPRFDDRGFSEESRQDEFLYNRSKSINPTGLPVSPRSEMTPEALQFRRSRNIGPGV